MIFFKKLVILLFISLLFLLWALNINNSGLCAEVELGLMSKEDYNAKYSKN